MQRLLLASLTLALFACFAPAYACSLEAPEQFSYDFSYVRQTDTEREMFLQYAPYLARATYIRSVELFGKEGATFSVTQSLRGDVPLGQTFFVPNETGYYGGCDTSDRDYSPGDTIIVWSDSSVIPQFVSRAVGEYGETPLTEHVTAAYTSTYGIPKDFDATRPSRTVPIFTIISDSFRVKEALSDAIRHVVPERSVEMGALSDEEFSRYLEEVDGDAATVNAWVATKKARAAALREKLKTDGRLTARNEMIIDIAESLLEFSRSTADDANGSVTYVRRIYSDNRR